MPERRANVSGPRICRARAAFSPAPLTGAPAKGRLGGDQGVTTVQTKRLLLARMGVQSVIAVLLGALLLGPLVGGSAASAPAARPAAAPIPLAGQWRFALDREDKGVSEGWFGKDLTDRIALPGVLQAQGYGDEISTKTPWVLSLYDRSWFLRADYQAYTDPGKVKVPFICQPPRHYLGAAWYQRDIEIPAGWQGRRVVLKLERPRWESSVWLDDRRVGSDKSLCAPHEYDLGQVPPGKHRLSIRVDNRMIMPYRLDAHSVSDSLGSSWNGIVGAIELRSTSPVWIDDAQVFPNLAKKSAVVRTRIGNATGQSGSGSVSAGGATAPVSWDEKGGTAELEVSLGKDPQPWDEFSPALQRLSLRLTGPQADDQRELVFGLREFQARGTDFLLNGHPIYLRGTHSGGDFPLTGYPPTDVASWKRIIKTCQEWGLNHMRFHSWCPPDAAFTAADELGFYLQPECGMWNQISPGTDMERMMYGETERMIRAYGNHPSFMLLSPSNEPGGNWKQSLPAWVERFRKEDPRRLYTTGTGWSLIDTPGPVTGADYLAVHRIGRNMLRGVSAWFGKDYASSLVGVNVPVASHELGQWCAYPDYDVIRKFTGYLRPGNYEIFQDSLAAHGLAARNKDFAMASGRYQLACYKEEIEANLRTPGLGGFQLLDLHDYVGQGTALVGLLDAFWEGKGYATAEEFRRFCDRTVLLARLEKRVFTTADSFNVPVEVAHYGGEPMLNIVPYIRVEDEAGRRAMSGILPVSTLRVGKNTPIGNISVDLSKLEAPRAYRLIVGLEGTPIENDWKFWLYPADTPKPEPVDVLVTSDWEEIQEALAAGGKVLFLPRPADLDWISPPLDAIPVFWNRLMNPGWGRMLGLWVAKAHPALAGFPTDFFCDWQWTELTRGSRAVNLDRLPAGLAPIVQPIDDWNRNYKLGSVFECRVGMGKLMVAAFDLESDLASRPVAQALRRSLLDYMRTERFKPQIPVSVDELRSLFFETTVMKRLGASVQADGRNPDAVIDGDPNTFWTIGGEPKRHSHELTISFPVPVKMSGLVLMPRQNHREHQGDICLYTVSVSDDGVKWREVKRGDLVSTFSPQEVFFSQPVTARFVNLSALSGFGDDTTAALAEIAVIEPGVPVESSGDGRIQYKRVRSATSEVDEGADAKKP